jgi:DNA primase
MAFSSGNQTILLEDILKKTTEADIASYYLGITKVPCIINSPLRVDKNPSFGLYSLDGKKIYYNDFSTKEKGGLFDLLGQLWQCSYPELLRRIYKDIHKFSHTIETKPNTSCHIQQTSTYNQDTQLSCKIRAWKKHDLDYWNSYGISLKWLKYAEVYPISHKIIHKDGKDYIFTAEKYAYAYVEHKEGKVTLKIYQPFSEKFKWCNKHDASVISLWTKVPKQGDKLCLCSSLKDALCLWANTGIPSIATQGEAYDLSDTAIKELRKRYKTIYVCLDNDEPGLKNAKKLTEQTQFINIVLPPFEGGKDISDLFKIKGKETFLTIIKNLFNL